MTLESDLNSHQENGSETQGTRGMKGMNQEHMRESLDVARSSGTILALVASCMFLAGCAMAAHKAIQSARGGISDILVIEPIQSLDRYDTVDFVPLENDVGANLSETVLEELNSRIKRELIIRNIYPPRGRVLVFSGRIIHIETTTLHKEAIIRVKLTDYATGNTVGIANITGEAGGVSDLDDVANGLADGVAALLQQGKFPQPRP